MKFILAVYCYFIYNATNPSESLEEESLQNIKTEIDLKEYPSWEKFTKRNKEEFIKKVKSAFLLDEGLGNKFENKILERLDYFFESLDEDFAQFIIERFMVGRSSVNYYFNRNDPYEIFIDDGDISIKFSKDNKIANGNHPKLNILEIINSLYHLKQSYEDQKEEFENFTVFIKKLGPNEYIRTGALCAAKQILHPDYCSILTEKYIGYIAGVSHCFKLLFENKFKEEDGFGKMEELVEEIIRDHTDKTDRVLISVVYCGLFTEFKNWFETKKLQLK